MFSHILVGSDGRPEADDALALGAAIAGSRRWGPVARIVTGGVGETLVSDASCSVLIVPRPSAARRARSGGGEARRPAAA